MVTCRTGGIHHSPITFNNPQPKEEISPTIKLHCGTSSQAHPVFIISCTGVLALSDLGGPDYILSTRVRGRVRDVATRKCYYAWATNACYPKVLLLPYYMADLVYRSWRTLIGCWEVRKKRALPALWEGNTLFYLIVESVSFVLHRDLSPINPKKTI